MNKGSLLDFHSVEKQRSFSSMFHRKLPPRQNRDSCEIRKRIFSSKLSNSFLIYCDECPCFIIIVFASIIGENNFACH